MMLFTTDCIALLKLDGRKLEVDEFGESFLGDVTTLRLPFSRCSGLTGPELRLPKSMGDMREGPKLMGVSCERPRPFWEMSPLFISLLSRLFCRRSRCSTLGAELIRPCSPDVLGRGSEARRCLRCCSFIRATSCSMFCRSMRRLRKSTSSLVWSGSSFISMCLSRYVSLVNTL